MADVLFNKKQPIITEKEARKLLCGNLRDLSDARVKSLVSELEALAEIFFRNLKGGQSCDELK